MKTVIEIAREAGFEAKRGWGLLDSVPEDVFAASMNITREIETFAELVRADERKRMAEQPAPVQQEPVPEHLDVRRIMLDIVPGDGSGHEVYAKSVKDVEETLSRMGERIEELEELVKSAPQPAQLKPVFSYTPDMDAVRRDEKEKADKFLAQQAQRKPLTDEEPMYFLQDTRRHVGNCPLWWASNGVGYTTDLREAQRYTLEQAVRQHRSRESDLPWLCSEIEAVQQPTVDMQEMHKLRSNSDQLQIMKAKLKEKNA